MTTFNDFQFKYRTEKIYTRKQMNDALKKQAKELTVNRVVQSFDGKYGPDCRAMQILAIHKTEFGMLIIVQ